MADNGNLHMQIVKFGGQNYKQWKFQIKCALRAKGIFENVDGSSKKPQATATNAEEIRKWDKNDATAMCIITSAMELSQIPLVEKCKTSKEIMDKLDSVFELKSETNKMIVHERFYQYKMEENDPIAQHIARVENLAQQITDAGETISDTAVITKILSTLPTKFLAFRQAWLSLEERKQTLGNLTARLLDEEANLSKVEEPNGALAAGSSRTQKGKGFVKLSKRITCFKCNKKGHIAKDCWSKNRSVERSSDESNTSAFTAEAAEIASITNGDDYWLMDSGASRHMTPNLKYFNTLRETKDTTVRLGDNTELRVKGTGDIRIEKLVDEKWHDGTIKDVWYVPDLKRNLFSEGTITRKGFTVVKGSTKAEIFEKNKLVAAAVRTENNLYKMLIRVKEAKNECEANITSGSLKEWHERLGHVNVRYLKEIFAKEHAKNVKLTDTKEFFCESCIYAKQHKLKFAPIERQMTAPGEVCHTDVCGPMSVESVGGARYFVLFKDDSCGFSVVKFVKNKSDVFDCLRDHLIMCKNKFGTGVKRIRMDNGREYINEQCLRFCRNYGVTVETSGRYTPEQNGRSERENRTIMESARAMLYTKDLPLRLWAEAVSTAVYLLNRTPSKQSKYATPYEVWMGKKPIIDHVRVFGCEAYLHVPDNLRKKLDKKSEKLIFVGYNENSTNYRLFDPKTNKIKVSRHVIFNENSQIELPRKNTVLVECGDNKREERNEELEELIEKDEVTDSEEEFQETLEECESSSKNLREETPRKTRTFSNEKDSPRSSKYNLRNKKDLKHPLYLKDFSDEINELNLTEIVVPETFEEAINGEESEHWKLAIQEELDSLEENKTWEFVPVPENRNLIDSKWVFKVNPCPENKVAKFKARLCARGFSQVEGIDYNETFAPTTRYSTIRLLLALATQRKLSMVQFDVKTAFLYGEIEEDMFMEPPHGVEAPPGTACKLKKAIYGLKQSPRCWNSKFDDHLKSLELKRCETDKCVYRGDVDNENVILILYVDDGLIFSKKEVTLRKVLQHLEKKFKITVFNEPKYFVGLEINRSKEKDLLSITVSSYISRLLIRFKVTDATGSKVPADPNVRLTDPSVEPMTSFASYRELVGSLIFLSVAARPDIAYVVGVLSRYLNNPGKIHWNAAKKVLRYLKDSRNMGIEYHVCDDLVILGYSDADFAGDLKQRRSTTGYIFTVNDSAVTWKSQRQSIVTCSTAEAEYVAASEACKEAMWLRQLCNELCESVCAFKLLVDNQSAIKLIRNPVFHNRSKHIDIRYHFIREKVEKGEINVKFVPSTDQIADIFTKALCVNIFNKFRNAMNMKFVKIRCS